MDDQGVLTSSDLPQHMYMSDSLWRIADILGLPRHTVERRGQTYLGICYCACMDCSELEVGQYLDLVFSASMAGCSDMATSLCGRGMGSAAV